MDDQELEAIRAKRMAEMQARAVSIKISNQYLGYILVIKDSCLQKITKCHILGCWRTGKNDWGSWKPGSSSRR